MQSIGSIKHKMFFLHFSFSLENAKMGYCWSEITSLLDPSDVQSFVLESPTILFIPARTLMPLTTYEFKVTTFMEDQRYVNNSAHVVVQVMQQDLVARTAGAIYLVKRY